MNQIFTVLKSTSHYTRHYDEKDNSLKFEEIKNKCKELLHYLIKLFFTICPLKLSKYFFFKKKDRTQHTN